MSGMALESSDNTHSMSKSTFSTTIFAFLAFILTLQSGCSLVQSTKESKLPLGLSIDRPKLPHYRPIERAVAELGPAGGTLQLGHAELRVPSGALKRTLNIEIQRLANDSLPPLPPGLINVTENEGGYRLLPKDIQFSSDVNVILPVKQGGNENYWSALGIRAYYWDSKNFRWKPLQAGNLSKSAPTNSEDSKKKSATRIQLESPTKHFTVMINAIVKAPDHAGPANFNENSISSLGAGDPTSNIDLIQPPTPNNQGTAKISFPIRLPAGRGAYTPDLTLSYSSDGSNGPLGVGWDLPASKIMIDHTNGVPFYDTTDQYVLDGVRLIPVQTSENSACLRQRSGETSPTIIKQYALRIHRNQRILACQGQHGRYWEVIAPDGARYYYGVTVKSRLRSPDSSRSKTGAWLLEEVEDPNGNITTFSYKEDTTILPGGQKGTQLYLEKIDYTSHRSQPISPAYRAMLNWNCAPSAREDKIISARLGFTTTTRCRLNSIAILTRKTEATTQPPTDTACYGIQDWSNYESVRCYKLQYKQSTFDSKTLLTAVSVIGTDGSDFYEHRFTYTLPEYTDTDRDTQFDDVREWQLTEPVMVPLGRPRWHLDMTSEENDKTDINAGVSIGACNLGGSIGLGEENPNPKLRFIDLNSDGIADRVWVTKHGQVRVALGRIEEGGWYHGPGGAEKRVNVTKIKEIEDQEAVAVGAGINAECTLIPGITLSAGVTVSLREAIADSLLYDADGDGRLDLLSRGIFFRGLPHTCRDGSRPIRGVDQCPDGLPVCSNPEALCFADPKDLQDFQPTLGAPPLIGLTDTTPSYSDESSPTLLSTKNKHLVKQTGLKKQVADKPFEKQPIPQQNIPNGFVKAAYEAPGTTRSVGESIPSSITVGDTSTVLRPEDNWGPYTSARRRLSKEGTVAASFDAIRPVIRWDAQHDGTIRGRATFRLKNGGTSDGVKVSVLKVTDPHRSDGTEQLAGFVLNKENPQHEWIQDIAVKFRWSLMFVFDPLEETPVTSTGILLDEVESDLEIVYKKVCPLGDLCRAIKPEDLSHRGPTNQLAYVYRFPEDFRISELPREAYWRLLPPLGPPVQLADGNTATNDVVVRIRKQKETETPVRVRVRCESMGSQHADDGHVCSLGTILDETVFEANEISKKTLTVTLPEPFIPAQPDITASSNCRSYDPAELRVIRNATGAWVLDDGTRSLASLWTRSEVDWLRSVAEHFTNTCYVGPPPRTRNEVHGFLFDRTTNPDAHRSWSDIRASADCVSYSPFALRVDSTTDGLWLLRSGFTRLMVVSEQEEAEIAKSVARGFSQLCYVGRGNELSGSAYPKRHRDYVFEYFDAPIAGIADHTRIMVEIDGENGVEVPPSAVVAESKLRIASLHDVRQELLHGRPPLVYKGDSIKEFAPENIITPQRTLYRVHPARQLNSFRVDSVGKRLVILATLVRQRHPLHLMISGDHIEGAAWEETVRPQDALPGTEAVTRRFELVINTPGLYYLRGYTEASFKLDSTVRLKAFFETCDDATNLLNCQQEAVPANLLHADLGYRFAVPDPTIDNPRIDTLRFVNVAGEVAHSFEPFAGGHHGFFYGLFKSGEALTCIDPYPCATKKKPHPLDAHFKRIKTSSTVLLPSKKNFSAIKSYKFIRTADRSKTQKKTHSELIQKSHEKQGNTKYASVIEETTDYKLGQCFIIAKRGPGKWKTETTDSDGDGICDPEDKCPTIPDDFSEIPHDGCPGDCKRDTDNDGVPDCYDVCPYQPGDESASPAASGCAGNPTAPTEPRLVAPNPRSKDSEDDPAPTDQTGCYVGGDSSTYTCGDGSTHPSHRNETGGAGHDIFITPGERMRRSWTFGVSAYLGIAARYYATAGLNLSFSPSHQYTDHDVMDWNGDGIVDFVSPNLIGLGARNRGVELHSNCYVPGSRGGCTIYPNVHESGSVSAGFGISFGAGSGPLVIYTTPEGEVKDQHQVPPDASSGIINLNFTAGSNLHLNRAGAISRRFDINGDGLPDQVLADDETQNLKVQLNLGNTFSPEIIYAVSSGLPETSDNIFGNMAGVLGLEPISSAKSFSNSYTYGGGGGLDIGIVGGSGSYYEHKGSTLTQTTREFVDINGDGLADIVIKQPNNAYMHVAFNMGDHFANPKIFKAPSWVIPINSALFIDGLIEDEQREFNGSDALYASGSRTNGWTGSGSVTIMFVEVGGSYAHTRGKSTTSQALRDVDSDGIPDRVLRTGEESNGSIQVSRGLFGRANLLKRIEGPLGSAIELEYARSKPTEESPKSRWNLSKVTVGQNDDRYPDYPEEARSPDMVTTFTYENAYYDRYEKDFFGYQKVTTTRQHDGRITEREYENRDFWLKGTLLKEQIKDSSGRKYTETISEYKSEPWLGLNSANHDACLGQLILPQRYLASTHRLRDEQRTPCDVRAPRIQTTTVNQFEGGDTPLAFEQSIEEYDDFGNALRISETHGGANHPRLVASVDYDDRTALLRQHIVNHATSIVVYDDSSSGAVLRHREAGYDDRGNLAHHEVWTDVAGTATKKATLDLVPDVYGFITTVTDANAYQITFTPDTLTHSLPVTTSDNFELSSTTSYDYRFQQVKDTTDVNDNTVERRYDSFGRLESVRGPYERDANIDSIHIDYGIITGAAPVRALTTNNTVGTGTGSLYTSIKVARFTDWFGRDIQNQTNAEVDGEVGRTISGRIEYDGVGRIIRNGEPLFVANEPGFGTTTRFRFKSIVWDEGENSCTPAGPLFCTNTSYDVLNRVLQIVTPRLPSSDDPTDRGGIATTSQYSIAPHPKDAIRLVRQTQNTDPLGKVKRMYYDTADRLVAVGEVLDALNRITTYEYSAVGNLLSITDARSNQRTFEYDLAGQHTAIITPDTGRTEKAYDAMGNLLAQTDQELCSASVPLLSATTCSNRIIRWIYDKNRLKRIDYPDSADVTYVYGDETDTLNRCAGLNNTRARICWIQDEAGTEKRSFGALGEMVEQTRTLPLFEDTGGTATYNSVFQYDSFGRLLYLWYPDGEQLTYAYDAGGRVKSVSGAREGQTTTYVRDHRYDVYGKTLATTFGNDVIEQNSYEPGTQRLDTRTIYRDSTLISSLDISYDQASNITTSLIQRNEVHEISQLERFLTYDGLHRLDTFGITGRLTDSGTALTVNGEYDYDDAGNITRQIISSTGSASGLARDWNYAYSTPARPNLPDTIGSSAFNYDARGSIDRIIQGSDTTNFIWNDKGQLANVQLPSGGMSTYRYDPGGARVTRATTETDTVGAVTELRHYPGPYYTAGIKRTVPSGCSTSDCVTVVPTRSKQIRLDGKTVASIVGFVDPAFNGEERMISYLTTSQNYLHADQVRSTSVVTGSEGLVNRTFEFLPYGEILDAASTPESGDIPIFKSFNGMEYEPGAGLYYFGARYYLPTVGRWISADPLAINDNVRSNLSSESIEDVYSELQNLYRYARNNPVSMFDSGGLWTIAIGKKYSYGLVSIIYQKADYLVIDSQGNIGILRSDTIEPGAGTDILSQLYNIGATEGFIFRILPKQKSIHDLPTRVLEGRKWSEETYIPRLAGLPVYDSTIYAGGVPIGHEITIPFGSLPLEHGVNFSIHKEEGLISKTDIQASKTKIKEFVRKVKDKIKEIKDEIEGPDDPLP